MPLADGTLRERRATVKVNSCTADRQQELHLGLKMV
jgi:hypothetical protein